MRIWFLLCFCCATCSLHAQTLNLVTTEWETFTSDGSHSARLNDFVTEAFERAGYDINITIERAAFAGSGLNTGKYDGQIDAIDLDKKRANFIYSDVYFPLRLHLISKQPSVEQITSFAQIRDSRVAIENRYAATPPLRLIREVKWSRNPSTFESISNIAGNRSNYLLSDSLVLSEFNRMLTAIKQETLHKSIQPLFITGLQVSLSERIKDAEQTLQRFSATVQQMLGDGSINRLFGIRWIVADINGDGVSEWITSSQTYHATEAIKDYPSNIGESAYQWDDSSQDMNATIVIDGKQFDHWSSAKVYLVNNVAANKQLGRSSFLDHSAYQKILKRW